MWSRCDSGRFVADFEVLDPPELRAELRRRALEIAARHAAAASFTDGGALTNPFDQATPTLSNDAAVTMCDDDMASAASHQQTTSSGC
ncbi:hypothetical protein [Actinopolymorpha pittospori]|uniref:Uncharacterized protein n=1 Tax=Actinopolymorpha pittospori TaxID=648752 RepID=A0A927RLR7_9ACTN|nr:hypothetical protein [Actinopolymorpha pittospori]MBE1608133.1 hypothetical protein [Actinopolymorpha pittospori]